MNLITIIIREFVLQLHCFAIPDNDDICDINLKLYAMEYVMLKNIVDNPEDSIVSVCNGRC